MASDFGSGPGVLAAVTVSALFIALGWGFHAVIRWSSTVGPNRVIGIRLRSTLRDAAAWREGHRAAEGWTRRWGTVVSAFGVVTLLVCAWGVPYVIVLGLAVAALLLQLVGAGVVAHRAARVAAPDHDGFPSRGS